jgi:hypothetical protein
MLHHFDANAEGLTSILKIYEPRITPSFYFPQIRQLYIIKNSTLARHNFLYGIANSHMRNNLVLNQLLHRRN